MNVHWLVVAALASAIVSAPVQAETTVTHNAAGLEFDIPDDWRPEVSEEVEGLLTITAPENAIVLQCWVLEEEHVDDALVGLAEGLSEKFDKLELDEPEELELTGLYRVVVHGKAEKEGEPILLAICLVQSAKKPVIFLGMGTPESVEAHGEALLHIAESIRIHFD